MQEEKTKEKQKKLPAKQKPKSITPSTPQDLLALAVQKDLDMEKLEKLMELQERWEAGEARKAFYRALSEFQSTVPNLVKDGEVDFTGQSGKRTHYKYTPLSSIVTQIRDLMFAVGLSYRYEIQSEESSLTVRCIVSHVMGHSETTEMRAPTDTSGMKNIIQGFGSTVTYLERYTLIAALGLVTADEDNDGRVDERAHRTETRAAKKNQSQEKPKPEKSENDVNEIFPDRKEMTERLYAWLLAEANNEPKGMGVIIKRLTKGLHTTLEEMSEKRFDRFWDLCFHDLKKFEAASKNRI